MASAGNGTTAYILADSTLSGPTRFSWHMWYRNNSSPAVAAGTIAWSLSNAADSSGTYWLAFNWNQPSTPKTFFMKNSGGTFNSATMGSSLSADTWYSIGGRHTGSSVNVFLNGVSDGAGASSDPTGATTPTLSIHGGGNAGTLNPDDGVVAEFALWSTNLQDVEHVALSAGVSPMLIRPTSLLFYAPLIRDAISYFGPKITATNTSVFVHPRIIHASQSFAFDLEEVITKLVNMDMDLGYSEDNLLNPNIANAVNMNTLLGLTTQLGINNQNINMAIRMGMKIRAKAGGAIASGRFREREGQKDG
jgi:hypothetical protein